MTMRHYRITHLLLATVLALVSLGAFAQAKPDDPLGAGDVIRVQVFQSLGLAPEKWSS